MVKTSESGGWDQDLGTGSSIVRQVPRSKAPVKAKVVRDDWDDDEDEEEELEPEPEQKKNTKANPSGNKTESRSEQNEDGESSKIWEEANKRAPMPELIVARASTSQNVAPPPPAALQPTLRILKRPSPSGSAHYAGAISPSSSSGLSSASGGTSPAPRGTLAEREAQYQEARSRIFGEKEKPGDASLISRSNSSGVVVVRDPLGPSSELEPGGSERPRGFGERRRGKK